MEFIMGEAKRRKTEIQKMKAPRVRKSFPSAEHKYGWLPIVLDAYAAADEGVRATIELAAQEKRPVACGKGCSTCCKNPTVPITQPELQSISWYASEVLEGALRTRVKARLLSHEATTECPFLVDDMCSIYEVRPLICRQYMVRTTPCATGENVSKTRPGDQLTPERAWIEKCATVLLKFWDFPSQKARERAFAEGFIGENARPMHTYDWTQVAKVMNIFETANSQKP